jgi:5-methylthioadenosine/S-adenosylhomocysteine deaminase
MSSRTLIRGGCVLALGAKTPNLVEGDVLIEDGRVAEIGRGLRARDAELVDATDTIVMPGFVDTHRHAWKTLFRHAGAAGPNTEAAPSPEVYGRHHQPDDVYAATLLGLLSAAEAGITTLVDWSDIQLDDRYTEAALQAHADAGLRAEESDGEHTPHACEAVHRDGAHRVVGRGDRRRARSSARG